MPIQSNFYLEHDWAVKYTIFLKGNKPLPLKINNRKLLLDPTISAEDTLVVDRRNLSNLLVSGLSQDKDYVFLNENAWKFVRSLYGGGPEIKRVSN